MPAWLRRMFDRAGVLETKPGGETCPRRIEEPGPWEHAIGLDSWRPPRNNDMLGGHVRTCSFCGSMHPDDLMEGLRSGGLLLGPTDKDYKVYVHEAVDEAMLGRARAKARQQGEQIGVAFEQLDEHVRIQTLAASHGRDVGKFYFMHLAEEQKREFIELLNVRRFQIGYPGFFYVMPYFIVRDKG